VVLEYDDEDEGDSRTRTASHSGGSANKKRLARCEPLRGNPRDEALGKGLECLGL